MSSMDQHNIPFTYAESITTGGWSRRPIDPEARRYFVYTLSDADGAPVYIGRSCNVAARLRGHHAEAQNPYNAANAAKAVWLPDVRDLSMVGPFTWDQAVAEERRQIKAKLPRGNRTGMPKDLA